MTAGLLPRTRQVVGPWYRRYRRVADDRSRRRLERQFDQRLAAAPPVVVFQMGKVASSTIYQSLRRSYRGIVLHAHEFRPRHPDPLVARLAEDFHEGQRPYLFISPVREPIERNISDFFENYERYVGVPFGEDRPRSVPELAEIFLAKEPHDFPAAWFDTVLRPALGIDVYPGGFPATGLREYSRDNARLLVLRSELPDAAISAAVAGYTGLAALSLRNSNVARTKRYSRTYREFRATVRFPRAFVDRMCASRYYLTFYGEDWHRAAVTRWCSPGDGPRED